MSQENARASVWAPLDSGDEMALTAGFLHSWVNSTELGRPTSKARAGMKTKGMVSGQWEQSTVV